MKRLLAYYSRLPAALLGVMLAALVLQQGWAFRQPPAQSYAQFEILLSFAVAVLAIWFIEGDREDSRVEYLWSLPVSPSQIFAAKLTVCLGATAILVAVHLLFEVGQLYWFVHVYGTEDELLRPYEPHWYGLRLHPLIIPAVWLPLAVWFGQSKVARETPRRVVWPLMFLAIMVAPWVVVAVTYRPFLPAEVQESFFELPKESASSSLLRRYNATHPGRDWAFRVYWGVHFLAALAVGVAAAVRAMKLYAGRELSPELEAEE